MSKIISIRYCQQLWSQQYLLNTVFAMEQQPLHLQLGQPKFTFQNEQNPPQQTERQSPQQQKQRQEDRAHQEQLVPLQRKIVTIPARKEQPNLIAGHIKQRRNDETIKRPSPGQYLSPQCNKNQKTNQDIRMKILIQNNRLRASIDTLKKDINQHRSNEVKIAQILRQSKERIYSFKQIVKDKSKKISQITTKNIDLRSKNQQLQERINQLNSYSIWQQNQITSLKQELHEKNQQESQEKYLQEKIDKLEAVLKNYENSISRPEDRECTISNHSYEAGQIQQISTHSKKASQKWGTMNELELKDIEGLKQKESRHDEELEKLNEINNNLKLRINQLESELEESRRQITDKEGQLKLQQEKNQSKVDILEDEIGLHLKKSLTLDEKLLKKDDEIDTLKRQIQQLKQQLSQKGQQINNSDIQLNQTIAELNSLIQSKDAKIADLKAKLEEREQASKKEVLELEEYIQFIQENNDIKSKQFEDRNNKLVNRINQLEGQIDDLTAKMKILEDYKLQNQENVKQTGKFREEHYLLQQEVASLTKDIDLLKNENNHLACEIDLLKQQKNELYRNLNSGNQQIERLREALTFNDRQKQEVIRELEHESEPGQIHNNEEINSNGQFVTRPLQQQPQLPYEQNRQNEHQVPYSPIKFQTRPLDEQPELEEDDPPRRTSRRSSKRSSHRSILHRSGDKSSELSRLRKQNQELQKLAHNHKMELIEIQYQYEQERQKLKEKIDALNSKEQTYMKTFQDLGILISQKEKQFEEFKLKVAKTEAHYEEQVTNLRKFIANQTEQIKEYNKTMINLQIDFEKQKQKRVKCSQQVQKLQQCNSIYSNQKVILEKENQQLKNECDLLLSSKQMMVSKKIEQLQKEMSQKMEEDKMKFSQNMQKKNKQILVNNEHKILVLEGIITQLKEHLSKSEVQNKKIKDQLLLVKQGTNNIESEKAILLAQKQAFDQVVASKKQMEQKIQKAQKDKNDLSKENEHLRSEIQVVRCQLESVKAENNTFRSKLALIQNQLSSSRKIDYQAKNQLNQQVETYRSIIEDQKKQLQKEFASKQSIKQQTKEETDQLTRINQQLKEQNTQLTLQLTQLKNTTKTAQNEFQQQQKKLLQKNQFLNKELNSMEAEKDKLELEINQLKEINSQQSLQIIQHENNMQNMRISLTLTQTQVSDKSNKIQAIKHEKQSQLTFKETEMETLKNKIEELNKQLVQLQEQQEHIVQKFKTEIQQLQQEKQALVSKNCQGFTKIQELQKELNNYTQSTKLNQKQLQQKQQSIYNFENILKIKTQQIQQQKSWNQELEGKLQLLTTQLNEEKLAWTKQKQQLEDNLEVSKKMMQEMEEQNELKIMKINKELSNYKVLMEQAQKQNSFKLEQSNRSITEMQTEMKISLETIHQKDQEIKQIKVTNSRLKEQLEKIKIVQQRLLEQKEDWSKQRESTDSKLGELAEELLSLKKEIGKVREKEEQLMEEKLLLQSALMNLKSQLKQTEMFSEHLEEQKDKIKKQNDIINEELNNLQLQNQQLKELLTKSETSLNELLIEKKKLEYKNEMTQESISKMKQSLRTIQQQRYMEMSKSRSLQEKKQSLEQDNQQLNLMISGIEKDFANKIQNLKAEHRQDYLGMERKYGRQMDELCEKLNIANNQKDKLKQDYDLLKKTEKQLSDELQFIQKKFKRAEQAAQQFDNERGEMTDKILQLTQESSDYKEQVDKLRSQLMMKDDQIFQYKEQTEALKEEFNKRQDSRNLKVSIDTDKMVLEQMIEKLEAINRQFLAKNEILQTQINQKTKTQRELSDQLDAFRARQTRERHNSTDSWTTKSKIFNDEKSESIQTELQNYKLKLESAEAYIAQLEDECQQYSSSQNATNIQKLQAKVHSLEKENDDLKMKVEYQQAYIDHLENDNINASIVSKRSVHSKVGKPKFLSVDKDQSMLSMEQSHRLETYEDNRNLLTKVNMITEFLENYQKDEHSIDRLEELRKQLNNHTLDELLNTIFYKIERDSIKLKQKQTEVAELLLQLEQYEQELKASRDQLQLLARKTQSYSFIEQKYEQTRRMLEDSLMLKMKQQAQLAESRIHIEELQKFRQRNNHDNGKSDSLTASKKAAKDALSILKQQNEDESSGSMMSADAESQIPSQMYMSKQMKEKGGQKFKKRHQQQTKKHSLNKMVSLEQQISCQDRKHSIGFLSKVLDEIDNIEGNMAYIEIQLEQKGEVLEKLIRAEQNNIRLANKLEQLEQKMNENGKEMNLFMEKSELQLLAIIKQGLKERQNLGSYGFQNESRRKIEQYLNLLEAQLTQSNKYQQDRQGASIQLKKNNSSNPSKLKMSLQQIKEDIINEDKGSAKGSVVKGLHSHSNSEGVQMLDPLQIKKQNSTLSKQIQLLQEELLQKEKVIKIAGQRFETVSKQISLILEDILQSFEQNQYLIDQFENIKLYLSKVFSDENLPNQQRFPSPDKLSEGSSRMILVESKRRESTSQIRKSSNILEQLLKLSQDQFNQLAQELNCQQVKTLRKKIDQVAQYQYDDCMDFLLNEQSLILDILKMTEQQSTAGNTMEKLAHRFSRQQIANIITNSHNKNEARNTLKKVLTQQPAISEVSDENDFSPDPSKMQQIRERISPHPTELNLTLHNHLLHILAAPTRQVFYDLIEQFYKAIYTYQNQIKEEMDEIDSHSKSNSLRIKKMLENSYQNLDFGSMQKFSVLQGKNIKNRSTSCRTPQTPNK